MRPCLEDGARVIRPHRTAEGDRLFRQEGVERPLWTKRMVQERGLILQGVQRLLEEAADRRGR